MCVHLCGRDPEVISLVWSGADDAAPADREYNGRSDVRAAAHAARTRLCFFTVNSRCRQPVHCYHYKNTCEATGGESTSCFSCFGCFFFSFKFCQSSPVFGELRPLVPFDGEHLMVSFVVSYLQWCIFFGGGFRGQRLLCRRGHIIGLQGKHAVHCWCHHILERVLERSDGLLTSGIHLGRDDLPDGWHRDKWHFLTVFILTMSVFVGTVFGY